MMTKKFRLIGATNQFPDHFMVYSDDACPTITGSIRRGVAPRDIKRQCCYLEIQEYTPGEDEYEVVDSWSDDSRMEV